MGSKSGIATPSRLAGQRPLEIEPALKFKSSHGAISTRGTHTAHTYCSSLPCLATSLSHSRVLSFTDRASERTDGTVGCESEGRRWAAHLVRAGAGVSRRRDRPRGGARATAAGSHDAVTGSLCRCRRPLAPPEDGHPARVLVARRGGLGLRRPRRQDPPQ